MADEHTTQPAQGSTKPEFKTAVFAGGGIKGVAYGGALEVLKNEGYLDNIDRCIGSSVGGLTATMLALGYTPQEITQEIRTSLSPALMDYTSTPELFEQSPIQLRKQLKNFILNQAMTKGEELSIVSQLIVEKKLGNAQATFSDLQKEMKNNEAQHLKNLEITITISDKRGNYQIVCSPETTPNMPIALAMRGTAGLPPIFPPLRFTSNDIEAFTKGATEPLVKYNRGPSFPENEANWNEKNNEGKINSIIKDMCDKSQNKNGNILGADGGIVDNLPIYLAFEHPDRNEQNTIAFNFEEAWRKKNREAFFAAKSFPKDIDDKLEQEYLQAGLNIKKNDAAYHIFQNYLTESRIPPSHHVKMLNKKHMVCIETYITEKNQNESVHIEAAAFDIQALQANALYENGVKAAKTDLSSYIQGEYSEQINEPFKDNSLDTQDYNHIKSILESMQKSEKLRDFLQDEQTAITQLLNNINEDNQKKEVIEKTMELLNKVNNFSEPSNQTIKLEQLCALNRQLKQIVKEEKNNLNKLEKISYKVYKNSNIFKSMLKKINPKLEQKLASFASKRRNVKLSNKALKKNLENTPAQTKKAPLETLERLSSTPSGIAGLISDTSRSFLPSFRGKKEPTKTSKQELKEKSSTKFKKR